MWSQQRLLFENKVASSGSRSNAYIQKVNQYVWVIILGTLRKEQCTLLRIEHIYYYEPGLVSAKNSFKTLMNSKKWTSWKAKPACLHLSCNFYWKIAKSLVNTIQFMYVLLYSFLIFIIWALIFFLLVKSSLLNLNQAQQLLNSSTEVLTKIPNASLDDSSTILWCNT